MMEGEDRDRESLSGSGMKSWWYPNVIGEMSAGDVSVGIVDGCVCIVDGCGGGVL